MVAATPRYKELADELRKDIARGTYEDGGFPTESDLCKRFGVSRFTVREALRALQVEGLIARRRGSGTVIQPAAARGGALHQPLSNVPEILQYARDTRPEFVALGEGPLPITIAGQLGLVAGGHWTRFQGIRRGGGSSDPIATTDTYVHESLRDAAAKIELSGEAIFQQLERLAGVKIVTVMQDIQAVSAPVDVSKALGMTKRGPCLRIIRSYRDARDNILEISSSHHPGDRFAYSMHIEVEG